MFGLILIARDHKGGPCLYRAERTAFDARHLDVSSNWIAGKAEVTLEGGFGGVRDRLRRTAHGFCDHRGGHCRGHPDFSLATSLSAGKRCVVLTKVANRRTSQ